MAKAVSIIIPTCNRYACLQKTLQSLKKQTFSDFEVIIANDGSTDQTKTLAKAKYPFALKVVSQPNSGRAAARNNGFSQAAGQIIIFIDDHIILDRRFVAEHYKAHQKYAASGVGVVRGRVEYIKDPARVPKNPPKFKKKISRFNENSPFVNFITNNISVTREALELTGGFDPDFKEYGFQDQELGYRIRQRGIKYKVNPKAMGYIFSVYASTAPGEHIEQRLDKSRQAGRSAVLFSRKHYWAGLQIGVNLLNVFLNALFSLNRDWLLRFYRRKLTMANNQRDREYWLAKTRGVLFLKGLREGFDKYPANKYRPRSGKNVVMLVSHQADLSGAPISLAILANNLKSRGYHPVFVLPQSGPLAARLDRRTVRVLNLHKYFKRWKLSLYVARFRPEIIHANTFLTEYALDIAKKFNLKTIMHVREDLTPYPQLAKADRIILISHSMVQNFDSDPVRLDVVHNAVEALPAEAALPPSAAEKPYSLLYAGSIEPRKGLWDLVRAVEIIYRQNKQARLTVAGQALPSEKWYLLHIQRFIKKHKLGAVINFAGVSDKLPELLDKASIVVVPSLSEPFGRVVIEAMSRKKLVVATLVGGIPEIIEQYRDGFLVHPENPEELAKMIMYVWNKSPEQKELVKNKAYQTVAARFGPDKYVDGVLAAYRRLWQNND